MNGFSVSEQTDEEAVTVWTGSSEDEEDKKRRKIDLETSKSVLALIGDKFCQLIKTEDTAFTWVKKDSMLVWNYGYTKSLIPCHFVFFTLACCLLSLPFLQLRSCGSEQWEVWGRCVTRVRPLFSTCTGLVINVALWFAWTAIKPERRRNPKVSCKCITDFPIDFFNLIYL